ncbi:MAG: DUF1989 domain-containing protein [Gammaproteobacteria bacterium]|nr:DUF1989 domain-containing protein [Gammaproteobacteria bacterium]
MQGFEPFRVDSRRGPVRLPGLPRLPLNMERYPIPGGGSRAIELERGDQLTIIDLEGLQPCELIVFGSGGESDPALIGATASGKAQFTYEVLGVAESSARRVLRDLLRRGWDIASAQAVRLLGEGSRAGDSVAFTAHEAATVLLVAPGKPMAAHEQNPLTPLAAYVRRSSRTNDKNPVAPPEPLADMLSDINIPPGTGKAYEVKAGQYLQIIDIKGRECTDFQAFGLRGLERDIDPTTTRSLMGKLYPGPGLYSKYYCVDQEPLVQLIQDTCGRHDTFGIACSARYYEDMGYPGHLNCSDNMNAELAPYGVRARGGWPAINFFFNTQLDAANNLAMDDPWSRPGDYVLLRALTDLVCVSTACPCDIDPANGWNPTDIQVRIYDAKEDFKSAAGFRMTTSSDVELTRDTGFHDSFAAHTRNFGEYNGYWLARDFPGHGAIAEYWACRERVIVTDLSPLRKYEVLGPDAEALLQMCLTRDVKRLSTGQVVYTAMCYEHGGMIDDGTVLRLGDNNFRWIGGNDQSGLWLREQAQRLNLDAWVKTSTRELCNVAVQGPRSREVLSSIVWTAPTQATIDELAWFRFAVGRIGDFHGAPLVVSRTGYTGELGYEVFCHPQDAKVVFDAIWRAGQPYGMTPLGLAALDMLRIEAGLIAAGAEFCDQTDPFEAGIGFTVPLKSKNDDFIGRAALERRQASPVRKLVGLDLAGGSVPTGGDCVRLGRAQVGEITSAVRSPMLGKVIALCRMDVTRSEPGIAVEVGQLDGQQKRIPATVVPLPHFDPEKLRVRGRYLGAAPA